MGKLVDGVWQDVWYDTKATKGHFKRSGLAVPQLDHRPTARPARPATAASRPRPGAITSMSRCACPWAHRTLIFRKLKKLEDLISVSVVDPLMLQNGWEFKRRRRRAPATDLFGHEALYQIYIKADPHYSGRVTVPVLWDKQQARIVTNESAEIIRMFNSAFDGFTGSTTDFYPARAARRRSMS